MANIKGLISPEEAKELNDNYSSRHKLISTDITKRDDNRSNWFSIDQLEKFIAHAKTQAKNNGYVLDGIRIYNGAYKKENAKEGYTTVFLIPTAENSMGKDGSGGSGDIQGADGLNLGQAGDPPGANYPQ